jgi:hypothetical protein
MTKFRLLLTMLGLLAATGCATQSLFFLRPMDQSEVSNLISASPSITRLSQKAFEVRTPPSDIAFYYHRFTVLSQPDLIANWEYHFVIKGASSPDWSYDRVAQVIAYLPTRDDQSAYSTFRGIASSQGGDAVLDMYRKPIVTEKWYDKPAHIAAYLYYGVVVRRRDKE